MGSVVFFKDFGSSSNIPLGIRVEWFYMEKFQNVNFEKPVALKVAQDYNNKKNWYITI
jgi:hypothetical protein